MDGCFADALTPEECEAAMVVVAEEFDCRVGSGRIGASRVNRSTRDDVAILRLNGF